MSSILIAGCGYLGTALGRSLYLDGWKVWGARRDAAAAAALMREGIDPQTGDLTDPAFLNRLPTPDVVLIAASPSRESDGYEKTYLGIARAVTGRFGRGMLKKVVFISSTSVYSAADGSWVDEKTDPRPDNDHSRILLEAEKAVLESVHPSVVFRLAGFYGPGRNRIAPIRAGRFKPALSDEYTNRIHVDDAVRAARLLIDKGKAGEIYIGADDRPSTQREFYSWLYARLGLTPPDGGSDRMHGGGSNKRCWNGKIKALGLKLRYPSYKEGYAALVAAGA